MHDLAAHLSSLYQHSCSSSLAPIQTQRDGELDTNWTSLPYARYFRLRWLRDIIPHSSPHILTRTRFCPARRATITNFIARSQRQS